MTERESDTVSIISDRFRMGRWECCSVMFKLWGGKVVAVLAILLGVSMILGFFLDLKFFIITLMVIFIVTPMILGFMYYYYGLGERCYFNVTDHTLDISDDGIKVRMYFPEYSENEEESNDEEPPERCVEKEISFNLLHPYLVRRTSVVFPLGINKTDGFLWLPESAYETAEEFASAVKLISRYL